MLPSSYPYQLSQATREHPFPLVFASLGGAHLYGCASVDSGWNLRGAHVLLLREVLGLGTSRETVEFSHLPPPTRRAVPLKHELELDFVTHDLRKFALQVLERNGGVLEQVLSPLVVYTTPQHEALSALVRQCVTRYHADYYLGASVNQWRLLEQDLQLGRQPLLRPLLYAFRTVLSGIHLMQTGEVQSSLPALNAAARLPFLSDLLAQKTDGLEGETLGLPLETFRDEHQRLLAQLQDDARSTHLPAEIAPQIRAELGEWVIETRLELGKDRIRPWRW